MDTISKSSTMFLVIILAASSFTILQYASAQSTPKQSIPEFSSKYIDLSYNVPPTYGTDQYTGKTIITEDGYHVDNRSIQFTIKNQPFTPTTDPSGNQTGLYYNFRIKGAYGTEWDYYPFAPNGVTTSRYVGMFGGNSTESPADLAQSSTQYTTITIEIPGVYRVPPEAQLEVQAQALIGYMVPSDYMLAGHVYVFTGQYGDWSNTQTITIGESSAVSAIPNPTSPTNTTIVPTIAPTTTPTTTTAIGSTSDTISLPVTTFVLIIAAFLVLIVALLLLLFRRRQKAEKVPVNP